MQNAVTLGFWESLTGIIFSKVSSNFCVLKTALLQLLCFRFPMIKSTFSQNSLVFRPCTYHVFTEINIIFYLTYTYLNNYKTYFFFVYIHHYTKADYFL